MRIRVSAAATVLAVGAAGCGAAKGLAVGVVNLSIAAQNSQINSDLKRAPYMACVFDTASGPLLMAIQTALPHAKYELGTVLGNEVHARPSVSRRSGSNYELEQLTGLVVARGDSNLVWLQYQAGLSEQPDRFFSVGLDAPKTQYDRRYYGELMKRIASSVNRKSCEERAAGG